MREIILNSIRTPDGTVLTSEHRHDFKMYVDKNGETYINDGGKEYLRRTVNIEPYEDLTLYSDSSFEIVRENITWGTYGKNGDEPLQFKPISKMSSAHIKAVVSQFKLSELLFDSFNKELSYRNELTAKGMSQKHWEED